MRITNRLIHLFLVFIASLLILPMHFCTKLAGGSEIGNPKVLAGVVVDTFGKGVSGIKLYLTDPMETDPEKLVQDSCIQAISRENGEYTFNNLIEGTYNLFGIDSTGSGMFLTRITVEDTDNEELIVHDTEVIKNAGSVVFYLEKELLSDNTIIYVPGTIIRLHADSSGEYVIKLPQSTLNINLYDGESSFSIFQNLQVSENQWIDLTGNTYSVPQPIIISGLTSGFTDRAYAFTADPIYLGQNHPVQYRFDWGESVSNWNPSNQNEHIWSSPGSYGVRVQARSARDTLSLSDWSQPVMVTIQ